MPHPHTLFTGQWADLTLDEVAELAAGWGYDGLKIAVAGEHLDASRWDDDEYIAERLGDPGEARSEVLDHLQPPQGPGDLRRPDRLPS